MVNAKTLERCFNEKIGRRMDNVVDTATDRIQNAILTAIASINTPKIELAFISINASSGRDATSVTANSKVGEYISFTATFENVSERNITLPVFKTNDETRINIPDDVKGLSVPGTHFYRQPHTHQSSTREIFQDLGLSNPVFFFEKKTFTLL